MPKVTQIKKTITTIIDVTAAQVTAITATLDDGTQVPVSAPVAVGDWLVTDAQTGEVSIVSDADFQAEEFVA